MTNMKGCENNMARTVIDLPAKDKTTIVTSKTLLERLSVHVNKNGETQTDFITRAIVNQLEKEEDLEIRDLLKQEGYFND